MTDQLLIIVPLLVLVVVLWFGFTGCSILYDPDNLPQLRRLSIRILVPAALEVTRVEYGWTDPGGVTSMFPMTNPLPGSVEDGHNVFVYVITNDADAGVWSVSCRAGVRDAANATADRSDSCSFNHDGTKEDSTVTFQAAGSPSAGDFDVACVGLT